MINKTKISVLWTKRIFNIYLDRVPSLAEQAKKLNNLTCELKEFKGTVAKRNLQDSYRFAEIAEYEDYKLNVANSNRVMITGTLFMTFILFL
jgi:hypothetical protein